MAELELEGLHADGEHLVLVGGGGKRYRLLIDDALRAAVRRDRPRLEHLRSADQPRPREIQSRIRAGESAEDVAYESGLPVEYVRRYEGPVLAERTYVAAQGRTIPIGRESGAPSLEELVIDRLAGRGVAPGDVSWTAVRRVGEGWELVLSFHAAGKDRRARWSVDLSSRSLHAVDDEGRWLSEVELGGQAGRRHLAPVGSHVYDVEVDEPGPPTARAAAPEDPAAEGGPPAAASPAVDPSAATADLLEELSATRGVRQEQVRLEEDELLDVGPDEPSMAPPPASASAPDGEEPDAAVLPLVTPRGSAAARATAEAEAEAPPRPGEPRRGKSRSRRTSIPSWDEIVFGAKPE
jgi:hypothetical protein